MNGKEQRKYAHSHSITEHTITQNNGWEEGEGEGEERV